MNLRQINFTEVQYFYKNPHALVDYSQMQSFSLIRSSVEIFSYYGLTVFRSDDIKTFFERLQLIQKKNGRAFVPSAKKIDGVLQCCLSKGENMLSLENGLYRIVSWNHSGYQYEIQAARNRNQI